MRTRAPLIAVSSVLVLVLVLGVAACAGPAERRTSGAPALFVTHWASNLIARIEVNDDGTLRAPARTFPVAAGSANPQGSVRSRDGKVLYVANWGSGDVAAYAIGLDGALTPVATVPAPPPGAVTPSALALAPDGRNLYMANFANGGNGTVSQFAIGSDAVPRPVTTVAAQGRGTTSLAVTPDGHTLVAANSSSGDVSLFSLDSGGRPVSTVTRPTGEGAFVPAISPDGSRAVVTNAIANSVSLIDLAPGGSTVTVPNPGREPRGVVMDAAGTRAYVSNFDGGTGPGLVTTFAVTPAGLRSLGPPRATGSNGTEGIALSHDGRTLYCANFNTDGDGSVTSFPVESDGSLGPAAPPTPTGGRQPDLSSVTVP